MIGKLLAADTRQYVGALRLQRGIAPLGRRGEQHDTVGIDNQGRRLLAEPTPLHFVQAGFDHGDADHLPVLMFITNRQREKIPRLLAHLIHRIVPPRYAGHCAPKQGHVGQVGTEQVVGENPVTRCNHPASGVEDKNHRPAQAIVQLLQELVG